MNNLYFLYFYLENVSGVNDETTNDGKFCSIDHPFCLWLPLLDCLYEYLRIISMVKSYIIPYIKAINDDSWISI